jgi:PAS domain S-box-containing protein
MDGTPWSSDRLYRVMVESVRDYAIFLMDTGGNVATWNAGAERMLGYGEAEIIGQPASRLFTPEDIQQGVPERELLTAASQGRAEDERWHIRKDGSRFFASGVFTHVLDDAGQLIGFANVMRDISEKKRAEEQLQEARETAETANRAKDHFLAALSHELRMPINPVLLTATAMLADANTPAAMRPTWEMIRQNIELEARLIDDLLDVMKAINGKMSYNLQAVEAHDLILKAIAIVQSDINAKGMRLVTDLTAVESHVHADPARLTQAVWNLVKNSVKFSAEGGTITIRTSNADGRLIIEVADTGIGIEAPLLSRIFNAFEQGEESITRRYGGLGLGLAIAKSVIESHGGTLSASSLGKDRGATFTIDLATVPAVAPEQHREPPRATTERRSLNILLVEDDAMTCRVMTKLLQNVGHTVTSAASYDTALEVASPAFDLVVSDVGLPGHSGLDLMRELKNRHGLKGIALTGFGRDDDLRKSRDAGFLAHLTKPVDFTKLEEAIQRVGSLNAT